VLTAFGAAAVTFMMLMYALERHSRHFVLAFACGCALSSAYGFLAGTWPFGAVEAIWTLVALRRYWVLGRERQLSRQGESPREFREDGRTGAASRLPNQLPTPPSSAG
jgi:hypothetical protein